MERMDYWAGQALKALIAEWSRQNSKIDFPRGNVAERIASDAWYAAKVMEKLKPSQGETELYSREETQ